MKHAAAAIGLVSVALLVWACERAGWRWPMERFDAWLSVSPEGR